MPLLPIDLQTNFLQIGNVGKEQAAQRDLAPLQQTVQATEIVKRTYAQDRSVNETRDSREGERIIADREGRGAGGKEGERHPSREREAEAQGGGGDVIRDPALGAHIDVVR